MTARLIIEPPRILRGNVVLKIELVRATPEQWKKAKVTK
jgi:hypothetical protein